MKHGSAKKRAREEEAHRLLADPLFLYKAGQTVGQLGVVGEERNRLIAILACLTKELEEQVSIVMKGSSSSGKSNLLRNTTKLFPPESVVELSSLSAKAPVHTEESLARKILFLQEYRGGKDAQLLIRLQQSEGRIAHEYSTVAGKSRGTQVAEQIGTPVVLTTTTDNRLFPDDETRFLSLHVDESASQNLAVVKAQVLMGQGRQRISPPLNTWRLAFACVERNEGDFHKMPDWLIYVAENLPLETVRIRRDWKRYLAFCCAIALLRKGVHREPVNIAFADYAVAYRSLEPAFSATVHAVHPQEIAIVRAVEHLTRILHRGSTPKELAEHLGWKESLVYKYLRIAAGHRRIAFDSGTRERNQKVILPVADRSTGFLPKPASVLKKFPALAASARYVDPLTGKWKRVRCE